jgi:4-amino-4-deoxy-L-arabinose transferase-like glycosyltransferase
MWTLPILCWFFIAFLLARQGTGWRAAFLLAAMAWGCLVTVFTEVLGFFDLLTTGGLAICWSGVTAVVLVFHFRLKQPWSVWKSYSFSGVETTLLSGVGVVCLATLVTAIIAPPNNWDSMTYHMSRVMHWLQNRSVDHYPTHILRQIEMNPWAEFAIAHFQALSGGDRYANLVQWFSMMGSLIGASLIVGQLGGDRRAQLFAAVVAATIPMGILQSSSTQNDYVVSFWLICLTWAGLQFMKGKKLQWAVVVGASLGLAILTKGTAYLYAFPFVVWIALAILRDSPRQIAAIAFCIVIPFALLNAPHYQRNLSVFSNPLGSGQNGLANENISVQSLISNLLRNTALQLSSPFAGVNKLLGNSVVKLHESLNIDLNDPRSTLDTDFSVVGNNFMRHEDYSGNFLHVVLAMAVVLTLLLAKAFRKVDTTVFCYVSALASGFLLFCLVLKWQPWGNRLLLPLLVLGAPATGVIAGKTWNPGLVTLAALVLLAAALPWAFSNSTRPLVHVSSKGTVTFPLLTFDRNQLYFASRRKQGAIFYQRYVGMAEDIKRNKATRIGLILSGEAWEYPLWVLIKEGNPRPVRIEHIEVNNLSRFTVSSDFTPDYYVSLN